MFRGKLFFFTPYLHFIKKNGFALQKIEVHTYLCLYYIILCCWIKHSTWHCRVAIQFEYCLSIIGLYIDMYGYGMLSMGFWLLSRRSEYVLENVQVTLHSLKIMKPRPIVFKAWRDTRTFSNLKSTHCTLLILLIINLATKKKSVYSI